MPSGDEIKLTSEFIPDEDFLYRRVHQVNIRNGEPIPHAFKENSVGEDKGMSVDWARHSTPDKSRNRSRNPLLNGIVSFITVDLRTLNLEVTHTPSEDNPAHTNIRGVNEEIRLKLLDLYKWVIKVN